MPAILRTVASAAGLLLALFVIYAIATRPAALVDVATTALSGSPEQWINERERAIDARSKIIPGTEKRIRWNDPRKKARTDWSLVYFHGFSASRQEIAPVPEMVADALGANLFETRLTGHGVQIEPLQAVTAEDWLSDGVEGLEIGAALGRRVVIIGTSTGATLALALAERSEMRPVDAMILISPNFAPRNQQAEVLTWPGGLDVAKFAIGTTRSWTPSNDLQGRYWTTAYPMEAIVEMMRLVKYLRSRLPLSIDQRLLTIYSRHDGGVDPDATLAALGRIDAPQNATWEFTGTADPDHHVLIGDILSPASNERAARAIAAFLIDSAVPLP
jgi:esterase/lipase